MFLDWEETAALQQTPHIYKENMQTPYRHLWDLWDDSSNHFTNLLLYKELSVLYSICPFY